MTTRPTLLFVHGAWHDPWSWSPLRKILESRGWQTEAIELPTVHAPNKADLSMSDDAGAVNSAINAIEGDVVVIAHSYGGVPVTQGAGSDKVTHIVYIAAFALDAGESLFAVTGGVQPDWWSVAGGLVTAGTPGHAPRDLFYADVPGPLADAASDRLATQSMSAFTESVTSVAWRTTDTTYIVADDDQIVPPPAQVAWAERAGSAIRHLETSHSPFLSQPEAVADIIEAAVNVSN